MTKAFPFVLSLERKHGGWRDGSVIRHLPGKNWSLNPSIHVCAEWTWLSTALTSPEQAG